MRRPGRALPVLAVAAAWSVVGVALSGLTRTLYTLLVSNAGGPAVSGVVGAQIALAVVATMVWPAASGSAASKFVARAQGAGDPATAAAVHRHLRGRTALTATLAGLAAVPVAVAVLGEPLVTALALLPLVLGYSAYLLTRGVLLGAGRVAVSARRELLALVVSLGLLAALLLGDLPDGADAWLVLPLALGYAAYALAGRTGTAAPGPRRPDRALRREVDSFVAWGVLGNVASAGLLQLALVVAGARLADGETGLLSVAVALATPASMVARSLVQVLFPAMARSVGAGDHAAVRRRTDTVSRGLVAVFVPLFAALVLLAGPLLRVAGPEFGDGRTTLRILLVAVLLTTLPVAAVASMTSGTGGGMRRSALMSACGLAVGLAGMALLTGPLGIDGIALAYLAGSLVTTALPWAWAWRTQGQRWLGVTLRVPAGLALLAGLVVLDGHLPGPELLRGAVLAAAFALVWAVAVRRDLRAVLARG